MRSENLVTNVTCNQNCTACTSRGTAEDPAFVRASAVLSRIDVAVQHGARELVLTGGEPTLRRDLATIVREAKGRGAERIVLETNATAIDAVKAAELKGAGLDLARVNLSFTTEASDALTRDPGGFARTIEGLRAFASAGVELELQAIVTRSTAPGLAELPAFVVNTFGAGVVGAIVLAIPQESPDERALLPLDEAGRAVSRLAEAARAQSIEVRLAPSSPIPPCVVPDRARHAHLFSLTRGGASRPNHRQVESCAGCVVNDRCPGLPDRSIERFGVPALQPVSDDRIRRRLSLVGGVRRQIARELVTPNRRKQGDGPELEERIVRVNFACNQACRFCFVSTHLPSAGEDVVRRSIEEAARAGARVTLSGGEPTLNPNLVDYVRLAREHSVHPVELQTNATRLDDALVAKLVEAGLTEVFVSLHGTTAELSDAVTEAPGTFVKTLAGLDALARSPLHVTINFVLCRRNFRDFPNFVSWAHARWPNAVLNVSFVASSTDVVPRERDLVPSYSEVLPVLSEALAVATGLGLRIEGFEAMCGVPLCLVPTDLARFADIVSVPEGFDAGEFTRAPACDGCALRNRCYGLRTGYAELYGTGELRTVKPA